MSRTGVAEEICLPLHGRFHFYLKICKECVAFLVLFSIYASPSDVFLITVTGHCNKLVRGCIEKSACGLPSSGQISFPMNE